MGLVIGRCRKCRQLMKTPHPSGYCKKCRESIRDRSDIIPEPLKFDSDHIRKY